MIPAKDENLHNLLEGLAEFGKDSTGQSLDTLDNMAKRSKKKKKGGKQVEKKKVFIVEGNNEDYLPDLTTSLKDSDVSFDLLTAANSFDALDALSSDKEIKLVVVDLRMDDLEAFKLLARIYRQFPAMPVIVMSAYGNDEWAGKVKALSAVDILNHPLDLDSLQKTIASKLGTQTNGGDTNNLTFASLLSLVEMEEQSTMLTIAWNGNIGSCYIIDGHILDATANDLHGEEALREMIRWETPEIMFSGYSSREAPAPKITRSLLEIVSALEKESTDNASQTTAAPEESEEIVKFVVDSSAPNMHDTGKGVSKNNLTEEKTMALEEYLEKFKKINGYKASAIMNFTGEILAQDSVDPNIDLGMVGATFNDIFRTAHEASDKIGLEACKEASISTPKGIIIMRCSGVKAKVHYHTIAIFAADGNQALAKMEMEKMIPAVMEELT